MEKLINDEEINWKGVVHNLKFYASDDIKHLHPVTQVQAVAFDENGDVILYKHRDGYWGVPGGTVEDNEDYVAALKREIREEISSDILGHGLIGYEKDTDLESGYVKYQLRFWITVRSHDDIVNDPDGKALEKSSFSLDDAIVKLNWGVRGKRLLKLADQKRKEHYS